MASWEVVSPHISNSMEQSSRPKVGFLISDIQAADGESKEKMALARPRDKGALLHMLFSLVFPLLFSLGFSLVFFPVFSLVFSPVFSESGL